MGIEGMNEPLHAVGDTEKELKGDVINKLEPSTSVHFPSSDLREGGDRNKPSEKLLVKPFNAYQNLSRFIDTMPVKMFKDAESAPPLVTVGSKYKAMSEKLSAHLEGIPDGFAKPVKFFWNHEMSIVKRNGVEVLLGAGRLGNVFLGRNQQNEHFALKYFNIIKRPDHSDLAATMKEAIMQERMAQKGAAPEFRGFGFIMKNSHYYQIILISTFIPAKVNCIKALTLSAMCLEDAGRRRNGYTPLLLSHQYFQLLEKLTRKVAALEECQMIHTDIKFDNILLHLHEENQTLEPYIIDYGSSHAYGYCKNPLFKHNTEEEARRFLKRYRQCAPEILFDPAGISNKTDIFSLGLVFRGIGYFLDIPSLVCLANKLRLDNQMDRPNCEEISIMIHRVFGKKPASVGRRNSLTQLLHCGSKKNDDVADMKHEAGDTSCRESAQCNITSASKEPGVEASGDNVASQLRRAISQFRQMAHDFRKEDEWQNLVFQEPE